jgi:hypothetical protein
MVTSPRCLVEESFQKDIRRLPYSSILLLEWRSSGIETGQLAENTGGTAKMAAETNEKPIIKKARCEILKECGVSEIQKVTDMVNNHYDDDDEAQTQRAPRLSLFRHSQDPATLCYMRQLTLD